MAKSTSDQTAHLGQQQKSDFSQKSEFFSIPFLDLAADYLELSAEIDTAVSRVLHSGWYILGSEVAAFEAEFAAYCGVDHAVGVASGTDALLLALRALGIGPGDEVITVAHTAVATVAAIELSGATPVFVDVEAATGTLDPALLPAAISYHTRAIVPVHLYGHPAGLAAILAVARQHNQIAVVEDCAQAHGAIYHGRPVGSWGDLAAFSFYPTKNLGALGDGGAVVGNHPALVDRLRMLRQYGWRERYVSQVAGYNSRLDELQAAVLRVKLRHLDKRNGARRRLAALYNERLASGSIILPVERPGSDHVYHLYVVQSRQRDRLQNFLKKHGIGTAVHYPLPVHLQPAYRHLGYEPGSLPVTERLAQDVLSLPLYPQLHSDQVETICKCVVTFEKQAASI
jgi:dTDP-3-amino-3,4,6-trideoxy-alpha-D-glucose transaminase